MKTTSIVFALGIIDILAGILLFTQSGFAKYVGLFLVWKGIMTLYYILTKKK